MISENCGSVPDSGPSVPQSKPHNTTHPMATETKQPEKEPLTLESISKLLDEKFGPSSSFVNTLRTDIKKDLKEMITAEIDCKIKTLEEEFTATTDFITAEQKDLKELISKKDDIINNLQSEQPLMQAELKDLEGRLTSLEKSSRDHNVELQAIAERRNENVLAIFKKLCETVNLSMSENDKRNSSSLN